MMIDNNFFLDTHNYLKKIATDIIIPNITIKKDKHITKVKFSFKNKIPNEQVTIGTK